ncbi:kinase-like domain-containing protein [Mycena galopus ATCC 62051]|nr:kinase-like domain-containing protein [Mycena galopus ATCC 62051]
MSDHSTPDHLSASSSSSIPSFVDRIDLETIVTVTTAARHRTTSLSVACTVTPVPKLGTFNAVWFIDFADGDQWVLRTPIAEWSPALEKRMRSDIVGIQLIQSRTNIPIPRIHDFSAVPENPFGRPYMLMDRVKGTQLAKLWFDPVWATEERRKTVFRSLVSFMSQLQLFEFPTIGSLDFDPSTDSYVMVPLLPSCDDIRNGNTIARGPYNTVHAYLLDEIARQTTSAPSTDHKVSLSLLRLFAGALPDHDLDGPPFVLSIPDFNYQNVFVNDNGEVTGLIDWDGIMVGPRQGGYAKYPSWITRDWDPLMYGYPEDESSLQEDSPSTLQMFRDEYLAVFQQVDPTSARYTRNSHVYEALEIAISAPYCRGHILDRLSQYVFGNEVESGQTISAWSLEEGIRAGDWVKAL